MKNKLCVRSTDALGSHQDKEGVMSEENGDGGFQPELIELMKTVLEDALRCFPKRSARRRCEAEIASHILACAAKGEAKPEPMFENATLLSAVCVSVGSLICHDIFSGAEGSPKRCIRKPPGAGTPFAALLRDLRPQLPSSAAHFKANPVPLGPYTKNGTQYPGLVYSEVNTRRQPSTCKRNL
jgi:hypothetical protein